MPRTIYHVIRSFANIVQLVVGGCYAEKKNTKFAKHSERQQTNIKIWLVRSETQLKTKFELRFAIWLKSQIYQVQTKQNFEN